MKYKLLLISSALVTICNAGSESSLEAVYANGEKPTDVGPPPESDYAWVTEQCNLHIEPLNFPDDSTNESGRSTDILLKDMSETELQTGPWGPPKPEGILSVDGEHQEEISSDDEKNTTTDSGPINSSEGRPKDLSETEPQTGPWGPPKSEGILSVDGEHQEEISSDDEKNTTTDSGPINSSEGRPFVFHKGSDGCFSLIQLRDQYITQPFSQNLKQSGLMNSSENRPFVFHKGSDGFFSPIQIKDDRCHFSEANLFSHLSEKGMMYYPYEINREFSIDNCRVPPNLWNLFIGQLPAGFPHIVLERVFKKIISVCSFDMTCAGGPLNSMAYVWVKSGKIVSDLRAFNKRVIFDLYGMWVSSTKMESVIDETALKAASNYRLSRHFTVIETRNSYEKPKNNKMVKNNSNVAPPTAGGSPQMPPVAILNPYAQSFVPGGDSVQKESTAGASSQMPPVVTLNPDAQSFVPGGDSVQK